MFTLLFSCLLGRWRGAALAALGIAFYAVLVGAGASVVRAALMGWLGLLAVQIGQRQVSLTSLAIVAAVMAAFSPTILWDVDFQLSLGVPSPEVLQAVEGYTLLRTDRNGWIELIRTGSRCGWRRIATRMNVLNHLLTQIVESI